MSDAPVLPFLAMSVLLAVSLAAPAVGAESLHYAVKDGGVVFTNLAGSHTRPVPGMAGSSPAVRTARPRLPSTLYDGVIERVAREHRLSPELVKAVAAVESNFDPHAVSSAGAQGLMQLMPDTARQYGVEDPFDPLQNLRAGSAHLRHLLDQFDGDLTLALAAYNAGATTVRRHGGVPRYAETEDYVRRVHGKLGRTPPAEVANRGRQPAPARPVRLVTLPDGTVMMAN